MKLIGSALCPHLNLRRAAAFHVHGSNDHAQFVDHVRVDEGGRLQTLSMSAGVHGHAVQRNAHVGRCIGSDAAKGRVRRTFAGDAGQGQRQIHDVAGDQRQIRQLPPGKHRADRRR